MRLDEMFERRLIEEMANRSEQIIFQMIPSREYSIENFEGVLKKLLNSQNFIHREEQRGMLTEKISTIENYSPSEMIPWKEYQEKYNYGA